MPQNERSLPKLGIGSSLAVFGTASLALIIETRYLIPYLNRVAKWEPILSWFLVAGLLMFSPLLIAAAVILKREGSLSLPKFWSHRLRFHRPTAGDWLWSLGAILVSGGLSAGIIKGLEIMTGSVGYQPPFLAMETLTPNRYWILILWFPYWLLNIFGEEILWRGTMLPRQEMAFGKKTWLFHGIGWGLFHLAFGWQLLLTLLPMLFVQSYVVQRRKNTWVGVIIHAGINGPAFIAIAMGWLK